MCGNTRCEKSLSPVWAIYSRFIFTATFLFKPWLNNCLPEKPEILSIRIDQVKPQEAVFDSHGTVEESYDATMDYQLGCKPEVTGGQAVAVWKKVSLFVVIYFKTTSKNYC